MKKKSLTNISYFKFPLDFNPTIKLSIPQSVHDQLSSLKHFNSSHIEQLHKYISSCTSIQDFITLTIYLQYSTEPTHKLYNPIVEQLIDKYNQHYKTFYETPEFYSKLEAFPIQIDASITNKQYVEELQLCSKELYKLNKKKKKTKNNLNTLTITENENNLL
jgi:hypothetical protein